MKHYKQVAPSTVISSREIGYEPDYVKASEQVSMITFNDVKTRNVQSGILDWPIDEGILALRDIGTMVNAIVSTLTGPMIWQLVECGLPDVIVRCLAPIFQDTLGRDLRERRNLSRRQVKDIVNACLEALVDVIRAFRHSYPPELPSGSSRFVKCIAWHIQDTLRDKRLEMIGERNDQLEEWAQDILRKRLLAYPNATVDQELDETLSSDDKVRVFMNRISQLRKIGTYVPFYTRGRDNETLTIDAQFLSLIELRKGDRMNLAKTFDDNPTLTVRDMLRLHNLCLAALSNTITGEGIQNHESWFLTRACKISFFARNLDRIRQQLSAWCRANGQPFDHANLLAL